MSLVEMVEVRQVLKRDGKTTQDFDRKKISRAIAGAWRDCRKTEPDAKVIDAVTDWVLRGLSTEMVPIEAIQDAVEIALMHHRLSDVAKAYIIYRHEHAQKRTVRKRPDAKALADYIHPAKYARYLPEKFRRETYEETVARVEAMHLKKYGHLFQNDPDLERDIRWAFDLVRDKRVLPSMRSMQFAGPAIEAASERIYNCTATVVDRPRVFSEALYFLLCGAGVGYSVRFEHVDKLPAVKRIDKGNVFHYVIPDSITGWALALDALVEGYLIYGRHVEFSYHQIRPLGALLKTSGGKAPGHLALKEALERIREVLDGAQGRKLRPIECHDIMCHAADAVLSGGVRRSSLICLFSPEDSEMSYAKTGSWFGKYPWRANANNSVALPRDAASEKLFRRIISMTHEWGEPGFYFADHVDVVANPCVEVTMMPRLLDGRTGFSGCNLTEINAARFEEPAHYYETAKAATLIGTLQAGYTAFSYMTNATKEIFERDALLGVSMTGMLDRPDIACDPDLQRQVAHACVEWNTDYAKRIGINPSARICNVKPSGTASLELGGVASGHHAHHARRYIRRVTANAHEPVFQFFRDKNPHMCVKKPNGDWVIEFPIEAPEGATLKEDIGAIEFLEMVRSTQKNWVQTATTRPDPVTGLALHHNVSNTVHVKPEEWTAVADYIWEHRADFTGVALLSATGDKDYAYAPNEAITTDADEARWNQILAEYTPVDYTEMVESEDGTNLTGEAACAGGKCEVSF